jgi:hypothetical protein
MVRSTCADAVLVVFRARKDLIDAVMSVCDGLADSLKCRQRLVDVPCDLLGEDAAGGDDLDRACSLRPDCTSERLDLPDCLGGLAGECAHLFGD